ncbi:MAG: DUF6678 family protein [Bdellovibrionales bacterium]
MEKKLLEYIEKNGLTSYANNTKWSELREKILNFDKKNYPRFRSKLLLNGHVSSWDGEWFYHFREVSYSENEWIDICPLPRETFKELKKCISKIGFEFDELEETSPTWYKNQFSEGQEFLWFFRLYGYK